MKKAPALLYIVIFLLVLAALMHAFGVTGIFRSWNWLRAFEVIPGTIYLVFKNVLLALGFAASAVAFILHKHWAPGLAAAFTLLPGRGPFLAAALVLFGLTGELLWLLGLAMAVCNVAGAQVGSHLAIRRGSSFVRVVFLVVVGSLIAKTAWDALAALP